VQCPKKTQKSHSEPQKGNADPGSQPPALQRQAPHRASFTGAADIVWMGYCDPPPPYSPDLAPSDYHFFTKLKEFLGGKRFSNDQEVEEMAERASGDIWCPDCRNVSISTAITLTNSLIYRAFK
jgi:hypothetical protein